MFRYQYGGNREDCVVLGMRLSRAEAKQIFREMDTDGAGYVLFDEFCAWCVTQEASFADGQSDSDTDSECHIIDN